ncbi:four helix bundle protein [Planctomycetota bacterium]
MPFDHEKLRVYQESLGFARLAKEMLAGWQDRYAVGGHLRRASGSILLNLAVGAIQRSSRMKAAKFDIALGSTLECAGCVDVAHVYELLTNEAAASGKQRLSAITGMLIGLRRSTNPQVREDVSAYEASTGSDSSQALFSHERLDVYQVALEFVAWLHGVSCSAELPKQLFGELDAAATGIVLNVAEGNGRFATGDHRRFLGYAQDAAVKAATCLDLAVLGHAIEPRRAGTAKRLLERVVAMLFRMIGPAEYD